MSSKSKDSFFKGAVVLSIAGIIIKIVGAVFRIPLVGLVGAEGLGYYQAVFPVYTLFFTLATAGFPTAIAKLVSEKIALEDYRGANRIFKVSHNILFITGIVAFCVLFFGSDFIVRKIMKNPNALLSMKAIAPGLLFVPAMSAYRGYFQGRNKMTAIAMSQVIEQIFRVVLGLYLAYILTSIFDIKYGAAGATGGAVIGSIMSIIYLIIVFVKGKKDRKLELERGKQLQEDRLIIVLKKLLLVTIPISLGACVMPLVNLIDSILVVKRLEVAGFSYHVANSLFGQLTGMAMLTVNLPQVITVSLSMTLVTSISTSYAVKNFNKARENTKTAIKMTLLIVLPCAFGLAALSVPIMHLLFPSQPSSLGVLLFTVTPCGIFLGLVQSTNGVLQGMGKPIIPVISLVIGMICKIIISYTFTGIHDINILGSAMGSVVAYLIAAIVNIAYIKRKMGLKLPLTEFVIKPLFTVIVMYIVVKLGYSALGAVLPNRLDTVVSILIGGIVYVVIVLGIGAITEDEIKTMPKGDKLYNLFKKVKLVR